MAAAFCHQCGAQARDGDQFCARCGAQLRSDQTNPAPFTAPAPVAVTNTIAGLRAELAIAIGCLLIGGLILFAVALKDLIDVIRDFDMMASQLFADGDSTFQMRRVQIADVIVFLTLCSAGLAMFACGLRLRRHDGVARFVVYGLAAALLLVVVSETGVFVGLVVATVLCMLAAGILAFAPGVRADFSAGDPRSSSFVPNSVSAARALVLMASCTGIMAGIVSGLLAFWHQRYGVAAVCLAVISVGWILAAQRLAPNRPKVRFYTTVSAVVYLLVQVAIAPGIRTMLLPIGLIGSAVLMLWLVDQSRQFFGEQPLDFSNS